MKNPVKFMITSAAGLIFSLHVFAQSGTDTTADPKKQPFSINLDKHPEITAKLQAMISSGKIVVKPSTGNNSNTAADKQVIRDILAYLANKKLVRSRGEVDSFLLTGTAFTLNGKPQPGKLQAELKSKYIKGPNYVIYYGNDPMTGKGIFQRTDNL